MMVDIVEEHLAEAAFLWTQWERVLVAPDYTLDESAGVEERLLAHLDGLVVAGTPAIDFLLPRVREAEEPGEVFAATWALLVLAPTLVLEAVKTRVADASPPIRTAMARALELTEDTAAEKALEPWLDTAEPMPLSLALDTLGPRGRVPGEKAVRWLEHPEGAVVAAALRALRASPKSPAPRELGRLLGDARPEVRWAAIEAGLCFGVRDAWGVCEQEATAERGALRRPAWVLLATTGEERFLKRLLSFAEAEDTREDALWALGFSGRVEAADACLRWMKETPSVARLAGEAFSAISGLRLEGVHALAEPTPEDALPPLEEEDWDVDLGLRAADALPLPAPEPISHWWSAAREDFTPTTRYLNGKPVTGAALLEALEQGPMRRRPVHALELMLRTRGAHGVQVRAFSQRQRKALALAAASREHLPSWALGR